jgi:hypothetical protein
MEKFMLPQSEAIEEVGHLGNSPFYFAAVVSAMLGREKN